MDARGSDANRIEAACKAILAGGQGVLDWEWEDHTGAVVSKYTVGQAPAVQALLDPHLPKGFTRETVAQAPAEVQQLVEECGGLRAGQRVLCSDPAQPKLLVAALWPWGGGKVISVRLWMVAKGQGEGDRQGLADAVRAWFSV